VKIVVIADDLTGAAEVAGAALRFGLSAEVQIGRLCDSPADVIVVDADSRSLEAEPAGDKAIELTLQAIELQPDALFKKVDSLLRGPVGAEIAAVRTAAGFQDCLLVCGNPRKKRTVVGGKILVDQVFQTLLNIQPPPPPRVAKAFEAVELNGDFPARERIGRECSQNDTSHDRFVSELTDAFERGSGGTFDVPSQLNNQTIAAKGGLVRIRVQQDVLVINPNVDLWLASFGTADETSGEHLLTNRHKNEKVFELSFQPVDASGTWNDHDFASPAEFKDAILANEQELVRGFVEHLLSYAIGRKLEHFDMAAVDQIVVDSSRDDYRMSAIIEGIVLSYPFQHVRNRP